MKKHICVLVLLLLMCVAGTVPVFAADTDFLPRVVDEACLLTDEEYDSLLKQTDEISRRLNFDVVVVTLNDLGGEEPDRMAGYINEEYDFGFGKFHDGVILLISMAERDWVITSTKTGQKSLNREAREAIGDVIVPYLSDGEYFTAFSIFAEMSDEIVTNYNQGIVYKAPFRLGLSLGIAIAVSLIVGLVVVGVNWGKLRSVGRKKEAADYIVEDSFHVAVARERYLYSTVSAVKKPEPQTHSSSGGGHSSTGGKF